MERPETRINRLIDAIYDAGASPSQWPSVISLIAESAGAPGGVVFGFSKTRGLVFEYNGALDPHCADVFKLRHINNAWVEGMARRPQNHLIISDSIISLRDLRQSAFYDEVLRPQNLAHGALATLTAGSDVEIQFSVQKPLRRGRFSNPELTTLRRLLPHVRRAFGISLRLRAHDSSADSSHSLIDLFKCPAFTLDRRGNLADCNYKAQLLATSGILPLTHDGLTWSDPSEHRRCLMAMKDVVDDAGMRALVITQGTTRFELIFAALKTRSVPSYGHISDPAAAVIGLVTARSALAYPLVDRYGRRAQTLTDAERRVADAAASGISNAAVAQALGISLNTVKTHLRRVYQKLDVKRQTELVLLLNRSIAD